MAKYKFFTSCLQDEIYLCIFWPQGLYISLIHLYLIFINIMHINFNSNKTFFTFANVASTVFISVDIHSVLWWKDCVNIWKFLWFDWRNNSFNLIWATWETKFKNIIIIIIIQWWMSYPTDRMLKQI